MDVYKMGLRPTSPTRPMTPDPIPHSKHSFGSGMLQKIHNMFGRNDHHHHGRVSNDDVVAWPSTDPPKEIPIPTTTQPCRKVGIGLPRQTTFKRQRSEQRQRLCPNDILPAERRAASSSRHNSSYCCQPRARSTPASIDRSSLLAPEFSKTEVVATDSLQNLSIHPPTEQPQEVIYTDNVFDYEVPRQPRPESRTSSQDSFEEDDDRDYDFHNRAQLNSELDSKWILNLSMHFRDKSDREKFFVTYAETPNKWRRVTVSCDYRNAEPNSLEMDLKELQFQRDKSLQIYEAIRESLAEIQFYDTVTNLKLETSEGRLHVHVTEDINEIIPYPPRNTVKHILESTGRRPLEIPESDLVFDAHLSGFVYRVSHRGKTYIKKEIPGPDTIDEFLYEVNALQALQDSDNVIDLEGIVLDDEKQVVKGLLISYAERGAVVDLLYDHKGQIPWESRERWARHAVAGLRDIHEEGYVQGDFTLSNIVVDHKNDAKIIDINRRGCPVGWEPPEIATKIASNQRISMYIGEKSDLYQLGMTLWALAMDDDEPERHDPPLSTDEFPSDIPEWYQDIVRICLAKRPRDRLSAKDLYKLFPFDESPGSWDEIPAKPILAVRTEKQYIDPAAAVERDDLEKFSRQKEDEEELLYSPESSRNDYTFTYPKSSDYDLDFESAASGFERGRRLPTNIGHLSPEERLRYIPDTHIQSPSSDAPNIVSISPNDEPEYDELELDGKPYLVSRGTFDEEQLRVLNRLSEKRDLLKGDIRLPSNRTPSPFALEQSMSPISDTTPRNSHAHLTKFSQLEKEDLISAATRKTRFFFEPELDSEQSVERSKPDQNYAQSKPQEIITGSDLEKGAKRAGPDPDENLPGHRSLEHSNATSAGHDHDAGVDVLYQPASMVTDVKTDHSSIRLTGGSENIEAVSTQTNNKDESILLPRLQYADSGFHEPEYDELTNAEDNQRPHDLRGKSVNHGLDTCTTQENAKNDG